MYVDEYDGQRWARNQMSWLIQRGQDMHASDATHAAVEIVSNWWVDEARTDKWKLLACDVDNAPSRSVEKVSVLPLR